MGIHFIINIVAVRKLQGLMLLAGSLSLLTCSQNDIQVHFEARLENTKPISRDILRSMEGIYKLAEGSSSLGSEFVCKTSLNKVSFFSNERGIFFILNAGLNLQDSSIQFAGFWRVSENTSNGTISFIVPKGFGSGKLLKQNIASGLIMMGGFTVGGRKQSITLKYERDFSASVKANPFVIFGHHGIQTNANPAFIENSLEAFRQAQDYGANSLEVDVRMTKDNVPVLYHDPDLNIRVIQKSGILADLDQITWNVLFHYVLLRDGQRIPSLEEALTLAVDSTELQYIWIDVKGNPNVFKYLEPIVRKAIARAQSKGRTIEIITDLPSDDVIDEYKKQPSYSDLPLMCELSLDETIALNCKYWGPRWTEGTLNDDVARAHSLGMKAFTWTLNSEKFIVSFMRDGNFDGLITDYPSYAVYNFYTRP